MSAGNFAAARRSIDDAEAEAVEKPRREEKPDQEPLASLINDENKIRISRPIYALERNGVQTIAQLLAMRRSEALAIHDLKIKSLRWILEEIAKLKITIPERLIGIPCNELSPREYAEQAMHEKHLVERLRQGPATISELAKLTKLTKQMVGRVLRRSTKFIEGSRDRANGSVIWQLTEFPP